MWPRYLSFRMVLPAGRPARDSRIKFFDPDLSRKRRLEDICARRPFVAIGLVSAAGPGDPESSRGRRS